MSNYGFYRLTFKDSTAPVTLPSELNVNSLINCRFDLASSSLKLAAIYNGHACLI